MEQDTRREQILDIINREFVGPDPIDFPGLIQDNGEEILVSDPPRIRYAAGIIFPQGVLPDAVEDVDQKEDEVLPVSDLHEEETVDEGDEKRSGSSELIKEAEELINLSNAYRQSAISLTASVRREDVVSVNVSVGVYTTITEQEPGSNRKKNRYARSSLCWNNEGVPIELPIKQEKIKKYKILNQGRQTNLRFAVTYRYEDRIDGRIIYTFTLENTKKLGDAAIKDDDCYFQTKFYLYSKNGFISLPENPKLNINDEDFQLNELLYRDVKRYAIGHGCAVDWLEQNEKVVEIFTTVFPSYEMKPIVPSSIPGVSLEMYKMSDFGDVKETIAELKTLCDKYRTWIEELKRKSLHLQNENYQVTAARQIQNCLDCHARMVDGIILLETKEKVLKAFQYMNRVMLLQQLHYNLPLQKWKDDGHGEIELIEEYQQMPDVHEQSTWYDRENKVYGKWRPFQLAFILMNLKSMADRTCDERKNVDLIWFPTGGGKTEAYLGLSAFTIFIRRLNNSRDVGTAILMRYTLRLLTAQQYERAASMICACEILRKEKPTELGEARISIGLWVGGETTPNTMSDAVKAYNRLYSEKTDENPFIMLKCPWCGAQMGLVHMKDKNPPRLPGYRKCGGRKKEIIFQCSNQNCDFSKDNFTLPLLIVDEAIYNNPPTLLLGTVDKFAMLPFRPEAQKIFGIVGRERRAPPDLIIQDELHLISGPLGSMVGHYETMIQELCVDRRTSINIMPKIIASTATISRAKEQCNALYNCEEKCVLQFPPSGLDAGDSFFAVEDKEKAGRKYVGILAPAASSFAMTTIRLYAALLYAASAIDVDEEAKRDPYWTNLGYFNSLRELGQAATWVSADIVEYLHTIYKRRYDCQKDGRYIRRHEELTSRIRSDKISMSLRNLGISYPPAGGENIPVDICLATNMISVGVDVPRLGMMTVIGQPKTTSEYIQATSRVGRRESAPGLIFTVYHPGKPRDKSYYEHFKSYHSRIYCNVEPTSVTPFSSPLRERALHAILIGMIRLLGNVDTYNSPEKFPTKEELDRIIRIIEERVQAIDPTEMENTSNHIQEILRRWEDEFPERYHDFNAGSAVPLMYPAGSMRNEEWGERGIPTPTSMRNVDSACEVDVIKNRYSGVEEE